MADDITYTSTSPAGPPNATKQVTDEHATRGHMPLVKLAYSADGDATPIPADGTGLDVDVKALPALAAGTAVIGQVYGSFVTCSTDITRPANTTQYAVNDALADGTPTAGGFTFTSAARVSGGSGIITDAIIVTDADAATLLQGEIMLFNQSVTAIADNAAFAITDAEAKTLIGKIPFTLEDIGNSGWYHAQNLNIGFTCVGTANLRFLVRVKNTYTPVSGEVLTFILKIVRVD